MTTSLISCYVCFCSTVRCYLGCSSSNILSRTFWTLSCHSNISGAQFCKYFTQFPEFSWELQWLTVSWQYLVCWSFPGFHLRGIVRLRMVHHFFEMEWYLRWHRLCVMLLGSYISIQGYLCKPTRTFLHIYALCLPMSHIRSDTFEWVSFFRTSYWPFVKYWYTYGAGFVRLFISFRQRINAVVVTSSNNKWEHVIIINQCFPIAHYPSCTTPVVWCQLWNQTDFSIYCQMFCIWLPNK